MNIKITIDTHSDNSVHATLYNENNQNIGTLWMTDIEFDAFTHTLTFGLDEGMELQIDDDICVTRDND
jgi:hypothetical protein